MGAMCCKPEEDDVGDAAFGSARVKSWKRHKWRSEEPLTRSQLQARRDLAWLGQVSGGGCAWCLHAFFLAPCTAIVSQQWCFFTSALQRMREEFWETEPHYGGDRGEHIT